MLLRPPRRPQPAAPPVTPARPASRTAAVVAAAAALTVAVAGCSGGGGFSGIYSLPLPGGASLGPHPYRVTAEFSNVLDLVPQSAVHVNDTAVGRVVRIYLPPHSWTARVVMLVNGRVHLPAGRSRSDSWLRPGQQPRGRPRMTASAEAPCAALRRRTGVKNRGRCCS